MPSSERGRERSGSGRDGNRPAATSRWGVRKLNPPNPLWGSNGVAFGPDGRLYAAQFLAGRISAVDPGTGDVETVVPADGPVLSPDDLAFGADGSMYIADLVPGRVWRRSPQGAYDLVSDQVQVPNGITCVGDRLFVNEMKMDGRLLELFPDGGEPRVLTGGLALGNAMQLGPDGALYYPHMVSNQVWRIRPDGGAPELVAEDVHEPVAVRFDLAGVLLVLSRGAAGVVTRIDLLGTGSRSVVTSGVAGLDNAAFDAENRMFVSSFASGGIAEMLPDGRTRQLVPQGLTGPFGVTVDLKGTVYTGDHYRLAGPASPLGSASGSAPGSASGPGAEDVRDGVVTHALRPFTHGVTADDGRLHMTSQYGEVRTYDPERRSSRVRASGLDRPTGIAVGPHGELVVAETGAGRVLALSDTGTGTDTDTGTGTDAGPGTCTVTVLAEGLQRPVDVAFDALSRCYVSDEAAGAVLRLDAKGATPVAEELGAPQGLAVRGDELYTVDAALRRLLAISPATGAVRVDAEELPVETPDLADPPLFTHGMPGLPRPFAGLAVAPGGDLLLSGNADGTVLRLSAPPA